MDVNYELEYYRIDLGQIWRIEALEFLEGKSSFETTEMLKQRYEELVITAYLNQSKEGSASEFKAIEPFVSHKTMDSYSIVQMNQYRQCKSFFELVKLGFFPYQNDFFSHEQSIFITPLLSDFEFWFARRLKHFENGYKFLEKFLDFNLEFLYHSDFDRYLKSLDIVLIQYSEGFFSENLTLTLKSWINNFNKRKDSFVKGALTWNCELFLSEYEFVKKGIRVNSEINLKYQTFFIQKYFQDQSIFESKNFRFVNFVEIFNQLKDDFLHHETNFKSFISLFQPAVISNENKLIWIGTYFELRKFIQAIDSANICNHISGTAKWQIGTLCFKITVKNKPNKGEVINIAHAKKISDASGKNSKRCEKLIEIVTKFKSTIENSPKT